MVGGRTARDLTRLPQNAANSGCYDPVARYSLISISTPGEAPGTSAIPPFCRRLDDVDQALVGAALKLFAAVLILVDGTQDGDDLFFVGRGMGPETDAPVRLAVSTIFSALWSIS
jgi:hypothetical protein